MRNLSFEDRLKDLNLHSLEKRRLRDLIEIYKLVEGFDNGDVNWVLVVKKLHITRNNSFKLYKFKLTRTWAITGIPRVMNE